MILGNHVAAGIVWATTSAFGKGGLGLLLSLSTASRSALASHLTLPIGLLLLLLKICGSLFYISEIILSLNQLNPGHQTSVLLPLAKDT